MDTTGSAELQGGGNVVTETPLLSQSSNGVHPAQVVEPEDPHLWDEWAVDIENRIQDVREYMGAIEKVLLGRVEGMFDQNQRERRNIDQKMAQIQQVLTEELETRIRQENPPCACPLQPPTCSWAVLRRGRRRPTGGGGTARCNDAGPGRGGLPPHPWGGRKVDQRD